MDPMMQLQAWLDHKLAPLPYPEDVPAQRAALPRAAPKAPHPHQKALEDAVSKGVLAALMKHEMQKQQKADSETLREANFRLGAPEPGVK